MTAALARNAAAARIPARTTESTPERETARDAAPNTAHTAPAKDVDDGARAIAPDGEISRDGLKKAARARPGRGAAELTPPEDKPLSQHDKQVTKMADRADRLFAQLVQQRDIIRNAIEFGDTGAAAQAFGRARELFREIVAIGNEAQINMSSSEDSDALTEAKSRISHRVTYAYEWANLIEEAMPGDQHI